MQLSGSCHCRAVTFQLISHTPCPFQKCYCTICRKTQGSDGAAINLGGEAKTLKVEGKEHMSIYHAKIRKEGKEETSPAERHFCSLCGSHLWLYDPRWPDLIHPQASAIDTPLPKPPELVRLMLSDKQDWVPIPEPPSKNYDQYPELSIEDWHKKHDLYVD